MVGQNFLDNLENLRIVTSTALEYVQDKRDEFVESATRIQVRQAEKSICDVRILIVQLEREFTILQYSVAVAAAASHYKRPSCA